MTDRRSRPLELWGGVECTVNRVGDRFFDQLRAGRDHAGRTISTASPRSAFSAAALSGAVGAHRPRTASTHADWRWTRRAARRAARPRDRADRRPAAPRQRPAHTSLLDPAFPDQLAALRRRRSRGAIRGSTDYTPVNEPLTTARFSGALRPLVSARPRRSDVRARPAQAVPRHRAGDAGDPRGQPGRPADPDRGSRPDPQHRRAALPGGVREPAPLADVRSAVRARRSPPPAVRGCVDHGRGGRPSSTGSASTRARRTSSASTTTSPAIASSTTGSSATRLAPIGGNRHQRYADVEAVRVLPDGLAGHVRPCSRRGIAITRRSRSPRCTPAARAKSRCAGWWKPGRRPRRPRRGRRRARGYAVGAAGQLRLGLAGDARRGPLRARRVRHAEQPAAPDRGCRGCARAGDGSAIAAMRACSRVVAASRAAAAFGCSDACRGRCGQRERAAGALLVVAGSGGRLGSALVRACAARGLPHVGLGRAELDITRPASIAAMLERYAPWAVVNAAGCAGLDGAGIEAEACGRVNVDGAGRLAARATTRVSAS